MDQQQDSVGDTLRAMDEETAALGVGIRRIPKAGQLRALNTETLQSLFAAADTTPMERSIYERELKRREADMEWEEGIRAKAAGKSDVGVARAFVVAWLDRYIIGEKTAAQVSWEVSRVLKMTYKDAELVVAGGFAFHDAACVESNQGMANATLSRNTIPPAQSAAWRAVFDGQPNDLAELSEAVKAAIVANDPTRAPKPRKVREPREPKVRAVREPRAWAVRTVKERAPMVVLSNEDQVALMNRLMGF